FLVLVPRHKQETAIPLANAHVVRDTHREALGAGVLAAFAVQVEVVNVGSALPKEVFVLGSPPCSLDIGMSHRATQRTRLRPRRRTRRGHGRACDGEARARWQSYLSAGLERRKSRVLES